jgi:hypothetical protein
MTTVTGIRKYFDNENLLAKETHFKRACPLKWTTHCLSRRVFCRLSQRDNALVNETYTWRACPLNEATRCPSRQIFYANAAILKWTTRWRKRHIFRVFGGAEMWLKMFLTSLRMKIWGWEDDLERWNLCRFFSFCSFYPSFKRRTGQKSGSKCSEQVCAW